MTAKKHWMVHALAPCRQITIDAGAGRALLQGGASLLPSGVTGVAGDFKKGEPVLVLLQQGRQTLPIAKGITRYGARDLTKIKGKKSAEITGILGYIGAEVIHRDDLVLIHE
ncbi:MAG: Glutamate 5-kinase [bacterium ADurb.Bin478]|nr:MAG: Glutamate 5-kinase [bacterium ADurb.Bin478]